MLISCCFCIKVLLFRTLRLPKRKCSFNDNIKREFPFIKGKGENVESTICLCKFFISHGGRADIVNHVKTKKHKIALETTSCSNVTSFLSTQEVTLVYHTAVHNHSFQSMDCTSDIVNKIFNNKFKCSQTKCKAIITHCIAPHAKKQIDNELKEALFISS